MADLIQRDQRVLSTEVVPLNGGDVLEIPNDGVPTQVANPGRAVIRTAVAYLLGLVALLPVINAGLAALQAFLVEQTYIELAPWVWVAVNGAVAVSAFISLGITRLLAVPGINEWVKAHLPWLAAIPLVKTTDAAG